MSFEEIREKTIELWKGNGWRCDPFEEWWYHPEDGLLVAWKGNQGPHEVVTWREQNDKIVAAKTVYRGIHPTVGRLIWFIMEGEWPPTGLWVDHIDRDAANCKWPNLRLGTPAQNAQNKAPVGRLDPSLEIGVTRRNTGFAVRIYDHGVMYHRHFAGLGDIVKAKANAYARQLRTELHGEFAVETEPVQVIESPRSGGLVRRL